MELPALLLFCLVSTLTPGPNNLMMTSSLNFGIKRTLPHLLGICIGFPIMVAGVGLGAGQLFERWSSLHLILNVAGVLYLLYLSWCIAQTRAVKKSQQQGRPFTFLQAALFQWVNPKAWMMAMGAVASFTAFW